MAAGLYAPQVVELVLEWTGPIRRERMRKEQKHYVIVALCKYLNNNNDNNNNNWCCYLVVIYFHGKLKGVWIVDIGNIFCSSLRKS